MAILRKTAEVCRDIATAKGHDFTLPVRKRLKTAVHNACSTSSDSSSALSTLGFYSAITEIYLSNAAVDQVFAFSEAHHIDNEAFSEGRGLITRGVAAVKASVQQESYISARISLGALCHTLQDFYSHSNWVELGSTAPFSALIKPDLPLNNIAGPSTPTCKSCTGPNCVDNILPEILLQKKITSGYFSIYSSTKPAGKCSHGGFLDRTSSREPTGGINKDDISSEHGFLHQRAADMAISATMEVLQDIRLAIGDQAFLRLMGLKQTSVLAFVIDTTGSMSDDIEEAKRVSFSIIDSRRGTSEEPSEYILVPFNDPDFGPLTRTEDADLFKERINSLSAFGGGDFPEMCLSGLLLALAGAPLSSDIFVFTDASAKDTELKSTVQATIERTKSTVTFMLTNPFLFRRRMDASQSQGSTSRSIPLSDIQLYRDLAHVSGGQTIEVTRATLSQATAVITDASTSALVTLFQVVRNPAIAENFTFVLDPSLSNVTVYVTGDSPVFTIYSPTGVSQSGSVTDGPLGSILTVGNLKRVKLNPDNQTGEWKISIDSTSFYSLKVTGQSSVNFLFNFVQRLEGGDFTPKANRPFTGRNATLFVSVTGGDSITVTDVLLVEASGSDVVTGTIKAVGATDFLVNIDRIPEWAFVVQLKGLLNDSTRSLPSQFLRQSPTQQQGSRFTITAQPNSTIEPGTPFVLNFTLVTNATGGSYTIRARTDRSFSVSFPSSLDAGTDGSAQGTVTLTAPSNTESGTDVTLTIEAEDPESGDSNYMALRFTVMTKVTDFSSPVCQVVSIKADCPVECSRASWELSTNITDVNGTGIAGVSLSRGNGSLSLSNVMSADGTNVTVAFYNASCCSPEVELVAVDRVGNVGTCFTSIKSPSTTVITNGSSTVSPNGSTTVSLNGSSTVSPNGSLTVSPNGSSTVSPNGSSTASPNGSSTVSPNGSLTVSPNGSSTVSPNGSSTASPNGSLTVSPNGSSTASPNGSLTVSPNGSSTASPNGSLTVSPNGSTTLSSNGSYSVSFSMCVALVGLLVSFLYG
ncbi:von Willebrand factor A domain-containing protein 7-like [Carassius gibelio]|uniref:von Willebrand factor A domain-containing protein 7-like n=1 Tax=Carassius gibelio TaxID=101364 RepID=UPI00227834C5|nr:von Willebrand factor A domain-containing protein 7-like [Carassius gibelio]